MFSSLFLSTRVRQPNAFIYRLVIAFSLLWLLSFAFTHDRTNWIIENLLVILLTPVILINLASLRVRRITYYCLFTFGALHILGSQFAYSSVPLGDWLQAAYSLHRNPYDRIVHFSFGFLIAFPLLEVLVQKWMVTSWRKYIMPIEIILSLSAFFELIEWCIGGVLMPSSVKTYVGTQGDVWDAQKDMALALLGAALTMLFVFFYDQRKAKANRKSR
ncbi:MAG: DUF2238 domain-containing protein [Bacteroidetes bacterium]|nr:DUF2238 domain-containing protein [Bacteroidota bacterium]